MMPAEIAKALVAFQASLTDLVKDKQGQRSPYSSVGAMMTLVKKAATDHGLGISMPVCWEEGRGWHLRATIMHSSGESWQPAEFGWPLIVDDMTNQQKIGSAVSYGRRYLLQSILGLASGIQETDFDEDDDGAINGTLETLPKDFDFKQWGDDALIAINDTEDFNALDTWDNENSRIIISAESAAPDVYNTVGAAFIKKRESFTNVGQANIQEQ
jgi:hypothetical protein